MSTTLTLGGMTVLVIECWVLALLPKFESASLSLPVFEREPGQQKQIFDTSLRASVGAISLSIKMKMNNDSGTNRYVRKAN